MEDRVECFLVAPFAWVDTLTAIYIPSQEVSFDRTTNFSDNSTLYAFQGYSSLHNTISSHMFSFESF